MGIFTGADGTQLAYHRSGDGEPLVCLPGGPMLASSYFGDLGGLAAHRDLVRLDLRGTGDSAVPADPLTYRCDRQVDDVEALRAHLGLDRMVLAGHSAGGTLAILYATRFPERVERLVLIAPSPRVVGIDVTDADRRELAELRRGEPWFPAAFAAFERIWAGNATDEDWDAMEPFTHGRWDDMVRARVEAQDRLRNEEAERAYYSAGAIDPPATRHALSGVEAPALLIAGEYDVALPPKRAAEYAGLFPHGQLAVTPGGGHSPWHDDPTWFVDTISAFLA
jgi:pimeloyl-ACP methyl ester carboxylesterase